ncbi:hypothetical protein ACLKA6_008751 [Drosophila palustris]
MPQSSPGRNRDEDPPNPHLVETVAKSSYDQRRVDTVTRICLILTWSRPCRCLCRDAACRGSAVSVRVPLPLLAEAALSVAQTPACPFVVAGRRSALCRSNAGSLSRCCAARLQ